MNEKVIEQLAYKIAQLELTNTQLAVQNEMLKQELESKEVEANVNN